MKLTIIVPDSAVYVNGAAYSNLSLIGIPANVHALQWQDTSGHLEFNDGTPNEDITELPFWAEDAYNVWVNVDAEAKKKLAEETAISTLENNNSQEMTDAQKLVLIIAERDKRLLSSDWTQLPDVVALHNEVWLNAWKVYRQDLRELPTTLNLDSLAFPPPPIV